jgi:hypothetical protein
MSFEENFNAQRNQTRALDYQRLDVGGRPGAWCAGFFRRHRPDRDVTRTISVATAVTVLAASAFPAVAQSIGGMHKAINQLVA